MQTTQMSLTEQEVYDISCALQTYACDWITRALEDSEKGDKIMQDTHYKLYQRITELRNKFREVDTLETVT